MKKTKVSLSNEFVYISFDARSGELLELRDLRTGENFIKNSLFNEPQPFILTRADGTRLYPAKTSQIINNADLHCVIHSEEKALEVRYSYLTDGKNIYPAEIVYRVSVEGSQIRWKLFLKNRSEFTSCRFPCINGVYLGEHWEDDTLYYPLRAGCEYHNPVEFFARPMRYTQWRWQEYRYSYVIDGRCKKKNEDGMYGLCERYPGPLSMSYLEYTDHKSGLYFASHASEPSLVSLGAFTPGPLCPAMCFFAQSEIAADECEGWESSEIVIALHGGDWHEGADIYRAYKEPLLDKGAEQPSWFDGGVGMLAHYDFKYQNGEIVHKYSDIPKLKKQAREFGLNHIMFAGWHCDGFDNGFPQYYPDPDLGTEEELYNGCTADSTIHTSCYINSRIANVKYKDVSDRVVIKSDGSPVVEHYGNKDISFACMCPGSAGWQGELLDIVTRVQKAYGMDGVYLDQLSSPAKLCYSKDHGHKVGDWCHGYKKILSSFKDRGLAYMGEMVCDEYGPYVANFAQTFSHLKVGSFPEMYRYTFPMHTLIDVLYPSKNLVMRPVFVEQSSDRLMQTAFVDGMYFWIYDLEEDNTFERDPEQLEKLKKVIKLRALWIDKLGKGIFRDTVGLYEIPQDCLARYYELDEGALLAVVNKSSEERELSLCEAPTRAIAYTFDHPNGVELKVERISCGARITIPKEEYAVVRLFK